MPSFDVIFAWIIAVLAGLACIGALAVVLVAEWYAIRRTIERHRRPGSTLTDPSGRWWREHSHLTVPERRP
jgi:O-antigen ligase